MRVVSIGDLVTDFYYKNGNIVGASGGMTSHNIVANLAKRKISTSVFGVCGNDSAGMVALKSLEKLGVDISNIKILNDINTRCFHVSYINNNEEVSFTSKKRCPFCNQKKWYEKSLIDVDDILNNLNKKDILVFDNLNLQNQEIINKTKNIKLIDLGQYFEFENLSDNEILQKIKGKFTIMNLNERVYKYFMNRFKLKASIELYKLFKSKLITITMGQKGTKFLYNNKSYDFKLEKIEREIDSTGAGDAFFSSIIYDWIRNDLNLDERKFSNWYKNSCEITTKVVSQMGARGHLQRLYKIIRNDDETCICSSFSIKARKQSKRCNININNLETRIRNAVNSNAVKNLNSIGFNKNENYLFVGTGGSFASAFFASIIINEIYGSNTYAMYPRDIIYRNNSKINKVILFSYSGTTNDLIEGTSQFKNTNKYLITKGEQKQIVLKTNILKKNIISYRTSSNRGKERGFLSFEGSIVPAAIFLKCYYNKIDKKLNIDNFIKEQIIYWKDYFDKQFEDETICKMFKKGNLINLFKGDYTNSAAFDLESKFIESGILNCLVHEKKNFSHGRFINYENLNNKNNIYFRQNTISKYEEKLLEYLKNSNNLIVESKYNGILCEFDLLLASQFLIYYIGNSLNIDVSKPKYSEDAMKIYFYKDRL